MECDAKSPQASKIECSGFTKCDKLWIFRAMLNVGPQLSPTSTIMPQNHHLSAAPAASLPDTCSRSWLCDGIAVFFLLRLQAQLG